MSPFQALKNVYLAIFFFLLFKGRSGKSNKPFTVILWETRITWTLLLPILIPTIIFKITKRLITNKDLEDALNESKKILAIYSELSEYEWRHPVMVFLRVLEKASEGAKDGDVINTPDLNDVYVTLIMHTGSLCQSRQETKDEYIARMSDHLLQDPKKNEEEQIVYKEKYGAYIEENLGRQFDLIVKNGKGNHFKEFYLGREFLFLKINIGKRKKLKPKEKKLAVSN